MIEKFAAFRSRFGVQTYVATAITVAGLVSQTGIMHAAGAGTADYTLDTANLQADVTSNLAPVFAVTMALIAIPVVKRVIRSAKG